MAKWGTSTLHQQPNTGFILCHSQHLACKKALETVYLTCSKQRHFSKHVQDGRLLLGLHKHDCNHNLACTLFPSGPDKLSAVHWTNTGVFGLLVTRHLVAVETILSAYIYYLLFTFFFFLRKEC